MSVAPFFSEPVGYAVKSVKDRAGQNKEVSKLSAYVIAANYTGPSGLYLESNPAMSSIGGIYGSANSNGMAGRTLSGGAVIPPDGGQGLRPAAIITALEIEEQNSDDGASNFSRTAKLTIRCFTLGQMKIVTDHFLTPGSSVFFQYGWNSYGGGFNVSPGSVSKYKDFKNVLAFRKNAGGKSDVYLGFVCGGSVNMQNDYWDVNVECKGHMELPAYLMIANSVSSVTTAVTIPQPLDYGGAEMDAEPDLSNKRWMMGFNALPSNKRTKYQKGLNTVLNDIGNFINVDQKVKDAINSTTKAGFWAGLFSNVVEVSFGGKNAELAEDTQLITDEKFIRFGALMDLLNIGEKLGFELSGGTYIPTRIVHSRTIISAFPRIFSTDRKKLFIPNTKTPKADFGAIADKGGVQTDWSADWNNGVKTKAGTFYWFPEHSSMKYSVPNADDSFDVPAWQGGYLSKLYVNMDFVKGIVETPNLSLKDAVYQILNGMSSAAGGIWDFQLSEQEYNGTGHLEIVDNNLISKFQNKTVFSTSGMNSPFMEVGMNMEISGQLASQIVLLKTQAAGNTSMPPIKGVFSSRQDLLLTGTKDSGAKTVTNTGAGLVVTPNPATEAERKKRDFAKFLEKVCLAPRVEFTETVTWPTDGDVHKICLQISLDELSLFESLKQEHEQNSIAGNLSILLPIELTLKFHGVSGFKRGDKINIDALPDQYSNGGFFQLTGIKQVLSDDYWTTELVGTFRTKHT